MHSVAFDMPPLLVKAFEGVLANSFEEGVDKAMLAHLLALPTEGILIEQAVVADVDQLDRGGRPPRAGHEGDATPRRHVSRLDLVRRDGRAGRGR